MDSVLILIAAHSSGAITTDMAKVLDGKWLAKGEALEVPVAQAEVARKLCAGMPIDVNVVPLSNRRKKVLLADMDSTMIPVSYTHLTLPTIYSV